MIDKSAIIKGITALEDLIGNLSDLKKDAVLFIVEKEMWEEFMTFHMDKDINKEKRNETKV